MTQAKFLEIYVIYDQPSDYPFCEINMKKLIILAILILIGFTSPEKRGKSGSRVNSLRAISSTLEYWQL